jgi:hypothetical protein
MPGKTNPLASISGSCVMAVSLIGQSNSEKRIFTNMSSIIKINKSRVERKAAKIILGK